MQNELSFDAKISRIKADKAIASCRAIKACDRDYAFEIMATALSNMQTNGASFDLFSDLRQDAEFWADIRLFQPVAGRSVPASRGGPRSRCRGLPPGIRA